MAVSHGCLSGRVFFNALLDYKEMKVPHIKALGCYPVPFFIKPGCPLREVVLLNHYIISLSTILCPNAGHLKKKNQPKKPHSGLIKWWNSVAAIGTVALRQEGPAPI